MFTRKFFKNMTERAVKTFAQAFLAAGALGEPGASVVTIDWAGAAGVAAAATLASVLTSVISGPVDEPTA